MRTDICIVGGGLAGLTAALGALRLGFSVTLLEKKRYPFHKVCGEYLSLESLALLRWMDLPLDTETLPRIGNFGFSLPGGSSFRCALPLGGLGISRFLLDDLIRKKAESEGGVILDQTRALSFAAEGDGFRVQTDHATCTEISARWVLGAMGRNKPRFALAPGEMPPGKRYIGVKRHIRADLPPDRIELHAFPGGYCGISAVENGLYCLCYLSAERPLDPEGIENKFLKQNPVLKRYLEEYEPSTPRVTTSGVFFSPRPLQHEGMLFLGDTAGMIPPLAGNGMSMAMHSAVLALQTLKIARGKPAGFSPSRHYEGLWKQNFSARLRMAALLQEIMEKPAAARTATGLFSVFPALFRQSVRLTHGREIPLP